MAGLRTLCTDQVDAAAVTRIYRTHRGHPAVLALSKTRSRLGHTNVLVALTRAVSPHLDRCELTHLEREPIDLRLAEAQHIAYEQCLRQLGCTIVQVPPAPDQPDSVFIEDTAVVVDELAVTTRPGAPSRRTETQAVAVALAAYRPVVAIEAPGTLDGGDVLRVNRTIYVGQSARTNAEGIAQLRRLLAPYGYTVNGVALTDCLHLKTAVTEVAEGTLLINPRWVDPAAFKPFDLIEVDPSEPFGANALRLNDTTVHAAAWHRTRQRLQAQGVNVTSIDASEIAKAEGGVTCCSVILTAGPRDADG